MGLMFALLNFWLSGGTRVRRAGEEEIRILRNVIWPFRSLYSFPLLEDSGIFALKLWLQWNAHGVGSRVSSLGPVKVSWISRILSGMRTSVCDETLQSYNVGAE